MPDEKTVSPPRRPRGRVPETLQIEGEWEAAVKKAIQKPAPKRAPKKRRRHK